MNNNLVYVFSPDKDINIQTLAKMVALLSQTLHVAIPPQIYETMTEDEKKSFVPINVSQIITPR